MAQVHPDQIPCLVYADEQGQISDFPELNMAGRLADYFEQPQLEDLIPLPEGSELFVLPERYPVGIDPNDRGPARLAENPENPHEGVQAVAAFIAPAHTANHITAFEKTGSNPPSLPLFAYTAVGWHDGQFWVSAFRSDTSSRQNFSRFSQEHIRERTSKGLKKHPSNRLVQHLGKCSLTYGCPAAKNLFLGREEAPLPTSPTCNAQCVGCISLQPSGCCPSTQDRIQFVPTAEEIAEIAIPHLNLTGKTVVSFGQGCEGEPLLQAKTIAQAIKKIRKQTSAGTINCNTNASLPEAVEKLAKAGLDSIRVSLSSAQIEKHALYYRPKGFSLDSVKESISVMKKMNKFVSLNYFVFPGFTDDKQEYQAFCDLVQNFQPDFIQLRNMNMDPDWYIETIALEQGEKSMGIQTWLTKIKQTFPNLNFGYFNPALF